MVDTILEDFMTKTKAWQDQILNDNLLNIFLSNFVKIEIANVLYAFSEILLKITSKQKIAL